jgi:long-chain acyl-CoA synthetase
VGKLADGTSFAPQFLENKLKFSPYINEVIVFGNARAFVAAMIAINFETVGKWAERRGIPYTSFQDLSAHPAVRALIRDEVQKCNASLPAAARICRFLLLNKEFDADDNELLGPARYAAASSPKSTTPLSRRFTAVRPRSSS